MSIIPVTSGRTIIFISNLLYSFGVFMADYNETHIKNPNWPPHAKFHHGRTMTLAVLLASTSLFFLYRPVVSIERQRENIRYAATIGSFYCAAVLSAIWYPETAWLDPEFEGVGEQRYLFGGVCAAMLMGHAFDSKRLGRVKQA